MSHIQSCVIRNSLTYPKRLPLIAPSVLSADFAHMEAECRSVLEGEPSAGRADLLHLDVMDGHFVPNLTMGPDMCRALRRALPSVTLDVHLMVTDPNAFVKPFVDAGADHLTFHVEAFATQASGHRPPNADEPARAVEYRTQDILRLAEQIREQGVSAGLAINPPTPIDGLPELIAGFEMVLVMSVNPGRSGQNFIPSVLLKTAAISEVLEPTQRLEMDGGLSDETIGLAIEAGCDVVVAGSAVFGRAAAERNAAIASLRRAAK